MAANNKLANEVNFHLNRVRRYGRAGVEYGRCWGPYGQPMTGREWMIVDVESCVYKFDCCGFVRYMLERTFGRIDTQIVTAAGSQRLFPRGTSGSPDGWMALVSNLGARLRVPGWGLVTLQERVIEGFILVTPKHLMISMGVEQNGRLLIADSTALRPPGARGMGTQEIFLHRNLVHPQCMQYSKDGRNWHIVHIVRHL